jgi:hypothetical protein
MNKQHRLLFVVVSLAMACLLSLPGVLSAADKKPSGTVKVESTSIAVGVGITWGDGTLTFKGKQYPFTVKGLSISDLGYAKVHAKGNVYDLKKVSDFAGTYGVAQAGGSIGVGGAGLTMKNEHDVVMILHAVEKGVNLTLGVEGLQVKMK